LDYIIGTDGTRQGFTRSTRYQHAAACGLRSRPSAFGPRGRRFAEAPGSLAGFARCAGGFETRPYGPVGSRVPRGAACRRGRL